MSKRKATGVEVKPTTIHNYAEARNLDFHQYSDYHMRLMDGGYTVVDIWTSGRYYVLTTDYVEVAKGTIERGGEKGVLPAASGPKLTEWLDKLFYPEVPNEL